MRTICRGSEVSDAAWAVEKILEYVSKEKEAIYCQLSPIARYFPTLVKFREHSMRPELQKLLSVSLLGVNQFMWNENSFN